MNQFQLSRQSNYFKVCFNAMASPCEFLLLSGDDNLAQRIALAGVNEVRRIEQKFSRYRDDNLCNALNHSHGQSVPIDAETFQLLNYAAQLFELSDGLFDITSGVLRQLWHFQPNAEPPSHQQIKALLPLIGFDQIHYDEQHFVMPQGMEIDFGGVGKEYCVDSVCRILDSLCHPSQSSFLVNLGGDLSAISYQSAHPAWKVGLESVVNEDQTQALIELKSGAVATSGTTKRCFEFNGKRYAHILNPKTGYPIEGAPRSVSVFAKSCTLAGSMSTLAQLQGAAAEDFLKANGIKYLCCW